MNKNLFILLGTLLAFLDGCTLAPKYTRPEAPVPADWPTGAAYKEIKAANGDAVSEPNWQGFFVDEKLRNVIELAIANNRDLRIAVINIEKTRAIYQIQRSELLPKVNASATASKERVPGILSGSGHPQTTELYNVNLGISAWELDFFGRLRNLKDQAIEQYLATEQARNSAQISLVAEVANAYLTLAADRELKKLAQDTLTAQEATYKLIQRRFDVGASSELELRQVQTQVDAARVDIARYSGQVANAENLLTLLVGSSIPASLLPTDMNMLVAAGDIAPGLPSDVLRRRPDILQAEHLLKGANANIGAARAAFFPRIALTTSIGTTSDELSGLFKSGSETWLFAPQITVPIFDSRVRGGFEVVKAEHAIFLAQYEKAIQNAFREVADALAQRQTVTDQLDAQSSLARAAAQAYFLSNARYAKGIDSYLSVLDSQRSMYGAQQGLITIRLARLTNLATLYKVLGGGD
ncbi:MAG: efflux transporter outer membrane subunit [Sedimentisphaerales bacterium]|nr:efflux transporter outer membrane subunit [Sedimentisphaerales bacterium]